MIKDKRFRSIKGSQSGFTIGFRKNILFLRLFSSQEIHYSYGDTMRNLFLFMNVSLDGYFEGQGHDISQFHNEENPFEAYSSEEGGAVDALLFGHRTYDMMKNFWPTPQAQESAPQIRCQPSAF